MAKKSAPPAETKSLADLGLETYTIVKVHRRELLNAPYNPRRITDQERDKLRKVIKRHGVVTPLNWNVRTKHIVGGHQRVSILDLEAGTDDYYMTVAQIDVDEARERELNVALNNSQAGGSFDLELLKKVFDDPTVTIEGAGFSQNDMVSMFGTGVFDTRSQDLHDFAKNLAETSERYSAVQERNKQKGESEHYLVFVFPSGAHVQQLIQTLQLEDNRYQNGKYFMEKLGVPMPVGG